MQLVYLCHVEKSKYYLLGEVAEWLKALDC